MPGEGLTAGLLETLSDRSTMPDVPALETRLAKVRRRIGRLVDVLAAGSEDLPTVRQALVALERERSRLESELAHVESTAQTGEDGVERLVEDLLETLNNVQAGLDAGEPEERKAVVRNFLQEIVIDKAGRRAILRWYRLPQKVSVKLVAPTGFEPVFSD